MKLLYVVNEAYFFLSHRLAVAKAAAQSGFEVHLAAPDTHVWAPADFSISRVEREGITFHPISLSRRGQNPVQELRTLASLLRLYRRVNPDIVHHITIKPNIHGGIAARICGVPAVVNALTGLGQILVEEGLLGAIRRELVFRLLGASFRHPNVHAIVQNQGDRDVLIRKCGLPESRIALSPGSGVDIRLFTFLPEPPGPPIVVLPSRLIWEKGVGEFVEAARRIRAQGTPARFVLVGDTRASNPRAVPVEQLRSWVDQGHVEWWGRREDMPSVLSQSHIVCLPTYYGEGVPRVLLEAAAAGRAAVTTDISGCREAVANGTTGVVVPPKDVAALTCALNRLITNRRERQEMGAKARLRAEARFDIGLVVAQTLAIYRDLVAN